MDEQTTRVRASDAEREQVAAVLRQAMSEGRLTLAEGEQRLAEAYGMTYRDELPRVTADLPPPEPEPRRGPGPAGRSRPGAGPRRPGRCRGVARLALLAAVALGIWAVVAGGPLWPAIVLGILAIVVPRKVPGSCRSHEFVQ